jgi:glycosyltransferase involved in cell wall biosynthesis
MLLAITICRSRRIPYLLRGDSAPHGQSSGWRRHLRNLIARNVVSASAGGLAIGQLNDAFYRNCGAPYIYFAPYSVDDQRFAREPTVSKADLLAHWGISSTKPVIMFCGKLYPGKRPLDLVQAVRLLEDEVTTIFVGDGVEAERIRKLLAPGTGVSTGFVNQAELPSYYHAADILVLPSQAEKWGLVVNEAMAAGAVPVVSDRVGAGPDLVAGVGEIYPCGDIPSLAAALSRALSTCKDPGTRGRIREHASRYSLARTADGFETAALAACGRRQNHRSLMTARRA